MGGFTQDDGYVQGVAPMHWVDAPRIPFWTSSNFCDFSSPGNASQRHTGIGTLLIPSRSRCLEQMPAYSGGVLAKALPEGLRYLSTTAWLSSDRKTTSARSALTVLPVIPLSRMRSPFSSFPRAPLHTWSCAAVSTVPWRTRRWSRAAVAEKATGWGEVAGRLIDTLECWSSPAAKDFFSPLVAWRPLPFLSCPHASL